MRTKRVMILVNEADQYGRDVLGGVAMFVRDHPELVPMIHYWEPRRAFPSMQHCDGAIVDLREETPDSTKRRARRVRCPVVNVARGPWRFGRSLNVAVDDLAVGRLAAEYLADRGFRNVAFYGFPHKAFSRLIQAGFAESTQTRGLSVQLNLFVSADADTEVAHLCRWLGALPKPVGILACSDERAHHLLDACIIRGLRVPEDVTVIGAGNDRFFCDMGFPELTSIALNGGRVGQVAAESLMAMLSGRAQRTVAASVPPVGVVERQSSNTFAVSDPVVVAAVGHIRAHFAESLTVRDLLRAVPYVSRRTLEARFLREIGRTPGQMIRWVRVEHAKRLLSSTAASMSAVAEASGFSSQRCLSMIFRRACGCTPSQFRRQSAAEAAVSRLR